MAYINGKEVLFAPRSTNAEGELEITENGTYFISQYEKVKVNVASGGESESGGGGGISTKAIAHKLPLHKGSSTITISTNATSSVA